MKTNPAWLLAAVFGASLLTTPLGAAETAVVKGDNVNVRGQPSIFSEVITQIKKGETVVVLEEITLKKPKTDEPARWARVQMPTNTPVWVNASYIDTNSVVKPAKLNIRAGAGENYSVVGQFQRGNVVKTIRISEDWMEVEAGTNAFAFVAADLLTKSATAPAAPPAEKVEKVKPVETPVIATTPVPPPAGVTNAPPVEAPLPVGDNLKPQPTTVPAKEPTLAIPTVTETKPEIKATIAPTNAPITEIKPLPAETKAPQPEIKVEPTTPKVETAEIKPTSTQPKGVKKEAKIAPAPTTVTPTEEKPPARPKVFRSPKQTTETYIAPPKPAKVTEDMPKRIVSREGIVRRTLSVQSPTYFELISPETGKILNYLQTTSTNVVLKNYRGKKVVVTGQELMDIRWESTPVIEIEDLRLAPDATK